MKKENKINVYTIEELKEINPRIKKMILRIIEISNYNKINNLYIIHDLFPNDTTLKKENYNYILENKNYKIVFNNNEIISNIDKIRTVNKLGNLITYYNIIDGIEIPQIIEKYQGEIINDLDKFDIINKLDIKKNVNILAKELKSKINHTLNNKVTIKDIELLINCYMNDNFEPMQDTKLYNNLGGVYCLYLELLNLDYNILDGCNLFKVRF